MKTLLAAAALSLVVGLPALADRDDRGGDRDRDRDRGHEVHGAPGPIAGAGLPFLAVGYGVYWLIKRRRKTN
jgi:hypothetical protein